MVPRQSQSYTYMYVYISNAHVNAEGVVVTQGTPQWYPDNPNPTRTCMCTLVMQKGLL